MEIKIWQTPRSPDKPHGVKFSVAYMKGGKRLLGYDNAEQKGYHRHFLNSEEQYPFVNVWRLLEDFKNDLEGIRVRKWDED